MNGCLYAWMSICILLLSPLSTLKVISLSFVRSLRLQDDKPSSKNPKSQIPISLTHKISPLIIQPTIVDPKSKLIQTQTDLSSPLPSLDSDHNPREFRRSKAPIRHATMDSYSAACSIGERDRGSQTVLS